MTMLRGCAALLAVLAASGCDSGTRPTSDCTSWPDSTVLAASPASGTTLAPGQSVEVSVRFQFSGCRTAGVTMYAMDQASRSIGVGGGTTHAQVPVGVTVQTIGGTLTVPPDVTAVSVRYAMILDARSGARVLAQLDYPVR